jgi:hypothetical protein
MNDKFTASSKLGFEAFTKLMRVDKKIREEIAILQPHLDSLSESSEVSAKLLANYTEGLIGGLEICLEIINENSN